MGIVALKKSEHGRTLCMAVYCEETSCGTSLLHNGLGAHVLGRIPLGSCQSWTPTVPWMM